MRLIQPLSSEELESWLGPYLVSPEPGDIRPPPLLQVDAFTTPENASLGSLTFVGPRVTLKIRSRLIASLVLAEPGIHLSAQAGNSLCVLRVSSVLACLALLCRIYRSRFERTVFIAESGNQVHPTALVEGVLGGQVVVGPFAHIGPESFIGRGSVIEARATILSHVEIGEHCIVQSGAVIGCSGFGFLPRSHGLTKAIDLDNASKHNPSGRIHLSGEGVSRSVADDLMIPHLAGVVIEENVFVGANTVIASGVLHPTRIGSGCKLDSHVQIAHGVELGAESELASQSGIAGSTRIGKGLRMGGAASIAGHLSLGEKVQVAACSGVTHDLPNGSVVAGFPARPIRAWRRREAWLRQHTENLKTETDPNQNFF